MPRPFPLWWPRREEWREKLAALDGSVPKLAAAELIGRLGVHIGVIYEGRRLSPSEYPWGCRDTGVVMVGCHRLGNEPAFLAALAAQAGKSMSIFAKPFALLAQGMAELAQGQDDVVREALLSTILPLMSKKGLHEASFYSAKAMDRYLWWAGMRRSRPSLQAIRENNERSLALAAQRVKDGGMAVIFPTGRVADGLHTGWKAGAMTLLAQVPGDTPIVPFRFRDYPAIRMARAVISGGQPPTHHIRLDIAPSYTPRCMEVDTTSPTALRDEMQARYRRAFSEYY